jgi:hypothetical protein
MEMLGGGGDIAKQCRKPEIMADAAYIILTRDARNFSGNFVIDEAILKEEGCTDMDQVQIQYNINNLKFFLNLFEKLKNSNPLRSRN